MPEERVKKPRLGQAATEFNVSMDRIIDILAKNGLEISSPTLNSKLTEEMYQCLQKELAKDKMVKEKSDQIITPKTKKEEAKATTAPTPASAEEESTGEHILIHTTKLPEVKTVEASVSHGPEVKIIGSVDPESLKKPSKPSSKKSSVSAVWSRVSSTGSSC